MRTDDFDYTLPPDRIAQSPAEPRDAARLLVVRRATGRLADHRVRDLPTLLRPGDLLVANDTRVIPARLHGQKASGGRVEILMLRPESEPGHGFVGTGRRWRALIRGRVRPGTRISLVRPEDGADDSKGETAGETAAETAGETAGETGTGTDSPVVTVEALLDGGVRRVALDRPAPEILEGWGQVPLPPYIETPAPAEQYQTVFARTGDTTSESGSAAAPTAGLHFTPELTAALSGRGIDLAFVTLHIGLDTFRPIETDNIADHQIHREWCRVPPDTVAACQRTWSRGARVVAVGTTAVRSLESAARQAGPEERLAPYEGWTDLYITPGDRFRAVDALLTNFHLPRSSLLVLVSAFAGRDLIVRAYDAALGGGYRFYSFGDAMLIL